MRTVRVEAGNGRSIVVKLGGIGQETALSAVQRIVETSGHVFEQRLWAVGECESNEVRRAIAVALQSNCYQPL